MQRVRFSQSGPASPLQIPSESLCSARLLISVYLRSFAACISHIRVSITRTIYLTSSDKLIHPSKRKSTRAQSPGHRCFAERVCHPAAQDQTQGSGAPDGRARQRHSVFPCFEELESVRSETSAFDPTNMVKKLLQPGAGPAVASDIER
jgi:hypothetical protein